VTVRLVVLVSGSGSNLQALLDAWPVGADRPGIEGLARADKHDVPTFVAAVPAFPSRDAWDAFLTESCLRYEPDLIVSAGFMKLVGPRFLDAFEGRYVNTHNALLPAFPGMHGPRDALAYGVKLAGATLHFVDSGVDTGAIIAQVAVPVLDDDTEDTLLERIKVAERRQLVDTVGRMAREGWTVNERKVRLGRG
jgi:phosphoribosylglycinamide formyltransferase 1